jgi:hypothetical protein
MAQKQGSRISDAGRLDGSNGSAVTADDFEFGAGWGDGTLVVTVSDGSTDQRGTVTVKSVGANQAQATATVTLTFKDGAYAAVPFALVQLTTNDNAVTTAQPTAITPSTTSLEWTAAVLPVANKTYTFTYVVVA